MAVLEIIRMGHPTLRQEARLCPLEEIGSDSFNNLIQNMQDTLHASGGIGLAAPQVNVSLKIAVIEIINNESRYGEIPTIPFSVFVNPVLTVLNESQAGYWEGCLSIPGMMGFVERAQHIRVDYLDENAQSQSMELKGFLATVFQHEFDHLLGHLYVDRMKDLTLFSYEPEYRQFHQGQLPELDD